MTNYETLLLFSPELTSETRAPLIEGFKAIVEREEGKITAEDHWGMRDLAYPVQKHMRGYYLRLEYQTANNTLVAELERNIRITDGIFKFITVKLGEEVNA